MYLCNVKLRQIGFMEKKTFQKLNEYCNDVHILHERGVRWIDNEEELVNFIDGIINEEGWDIIADDTHRWVESDGFYEVEFNLSTPYGDVYINNKSGGRDLQDEWSESNPHYCHSIDECYLDEQSWDWYYFLYELVRVLEKNLNFD